MLLILLIFYAVSTNSAFLAPSCSEELCCCFPVVFATAKPLGMKLSGELIIQGFHRNTTAANSKMPAESTGWLRVGDRLVGVNDKIVEGIDLATVAQIIASASVPKRLTFLAGGGANRTAEMALVFDGPQGIHGHSGVIELGKDGIPLGSVPFLQGMFGGQIRSCRTAPLVLAVPQYGCGAYRNQDAIFNSISLVERGLCAFSDKALMAQQASAVAIIVMNDSPEIVRMPIDEEEKKRSGNDIAIPSVMIDQTDAQTIKHLIEHAEKSGNRNKIVARFVRQGQTCKPWPGAAKKAASSDATGDGEENESEKKSDIGDPAAPSGELLLFSPETVRSMNISEDEKNRKEEESSRKKAYEIRNGALRGTQSIQSDLPPHVHEEGLYSETDEEGRTLGSDGLLHNPDDALSFSGFKRSEKMIKEHNERNLEISSHEKHKSDDDLIKAVDIDKTTGETEAIKEEAEAEDTPDSLLLAQRMNADYRFEYLLSKARQPVPQGRLPLFMAESVNGCDPVPLKDLLAVKGSAYLVERGDCTFAEKALNAAAAGAALLIVSNNNAGLFSMQTADGDINSNSTQGGLGELLPAVMITKIAGRALRSVIHSWRERNVKMESNDASNSMRHAGEHEGAHLLSEKDFSVSFIGDGTYAPIWEELTTLTDTTLWPESASQRRKLYLRLSRLHHPDKASGSADRFELLSYLYQRANFKYDPSSEPDFVDDYKAGHTGN
jgi:hypothetical protein